MKKITCWLNESAYTSILSPACKMCAEGSKLVLLITGLCSAKCYYCPLSFKKCGKDRIFADEWELIDENDTDKLIKEAELIDAKGAGITGGDPLNVWKRTKRYIELLKNTFGTKFNIHLYTAGIENSEYIPDLVSSGLDEIRFHPNPKKWDKMDESLVFKSIKKVVDTNVDITIEIPSIPDMDTEILRLIEWANNIGIKWINLNELEFSERNCDALIKKGFDVKADISAAVKGSQEAAYKILNKVAEEDFDIGVHYCSSSFKDGIQLRNRIKRRAENIARKHDIITEDGTLLKGIIETNNISELSKLYLILTSEFNIPKNLIFKNNEKNRIETGTWVLEKIAPDLKKRGIFCYIIEEYPTADALEVERTPLPLYIN